MNVLVCRRLDNRQCSSLPAVFEWKALTPLQKNCLIQSLLHEERMVLLWLKQGLRTPQSYIQFPALLQHSLVSVRESVSAPSVDTTVRSDRMITTVPYVGIERLPLISMGFGSGPEFAGLNRTVWAPEEPFAVTCSVTSPRCMVQVDGGYNSGESSEGCLLLLE